MDKSHGRVDERKLWTLTVDGGASGFAGAAQIFRIEQQSDHLRQGKVVKTSKDVRYGVTSLPVEEYDAETDAMEGTGLSITGIGSVFEAYFGRMKGLCLG